MFYGGKLIWFWCFWPEGSGAGLKLMQDTNGSGKEMYCAESMAEEMFYIYLCQFACVKEWFIEEIQGTESPKSQNLGKSWKFWGKKNTFSWVPLWVLVNKNIQSKSPPTKKKTPWLSHKVRAPPSYVCWWYPLHYTSSSSTIEFTKLVNFSTLKTTIKSQKKKHHFLAIFWPPRGLRCSVSPCFTPIPKPPLFGPSVAHRGAPASLWRCA